VALAAVLAAGGGLLNAAVREALDVVQEIGAVSVTAFAEPAVLARGLALTGMYPAVTWVAYMAVGIVLARALVARPRPGRLAAAVVVAAAVVAGVRAVSAYVARPAAVAAGIPAELADVVGFGAPLTTQWWSAASATPHTGSPADVLAGASTAVAVICALTLACGGTRRLPRALEPLRAAGGAPLTAYCAHVLLTALTTALLLASASQEVPWYYAGLGVFACHVGLVLALGAALALAGRRGPLEALVSRLVGLVGRPRRPAPRPPGPRRRGSADPAP